MPSTNVVFLIATLVREPELSQTGEYDVARMRVSTRERVTDKKGAKVNRADFFDVVVTSQHLVSVLSRKARVGDTLHIQGRLQNTRYTDSAGEPHYRTEIHVDQHNSKLLVLQGTSRKDSSDDDNVAPCVSF